jgi:hypothetical protein
LFVNKLDWIISSCVLVRSYGSGFPAAHSCECMRARLMVHWRRKIDRLLNLGRVLQDLPYAAGDSYGGAHISYFFGPNRLLEYV